MLFLQSLQLSRIAHCQLNPLKYCLDTIAQRFALITTTYQLAYCYTVLEFNARPKIATDYGFKLLWNMSDETWFPFDPYLLKISNKYIADNYNVYQYNGTEDCSSAENALTRYLDSESVEEDEFLTADKR
ncbi:hypothetical protein M5D96_014236 [Drosophila gunungcola]|uniref:Uncharacterized protein n=1 Tax=Drosophila gunungcola TaxID=103775 RepID=A0A9P9Y9X8_9MUSC|nr:hypothetical protein M5D96_014236 [Drosophila gunungcola]